LPTELSLLEKGECYIKYPGDLPCTKMQTPHKTPAVLNDHPFLLKPEKKRVYTFQTHLNANESPQEKEVSSSFEL
jgi:hypothetical protein